MKQSFKPLPRQSQRLLVVATITWAISLSAASTQQSAAPPVPEQAITFGAGDARAMLDRYCVSCHNDRLHTAGLSLQSTDVAHPEQDSAVWEKVMLRLRAGAMPPPGRPRPEKADGASLVAWLEGELDAAAAHAMRPGRTDTVHRLNRAEYKNAIRDLLALDLDVAALLPADNPDQHGFDNIANMLSVSPMFLERYLAAARRVSRQAVGLPPHGAITERYQVPLTLDQDVIVSEELPFGSRGGFVIRHYVPVDGEYEVKVQLRRQLYDYVIGLGERHTFEIRVDGRRVFASVVGGDMKGLPAPASFAGEILAEPAVENYMLTADAGLQVRVPLPAGPRLITMSFLARTTEPEDRVSRPTKRDRIEIARDESLESNPFVGSVAISGPLGATSSGDTPSRRQIFTCRPSPEATRGTEETCAWTILSRLSKLAYRRPVAEGEVRTLLQFFQDGRRNGNFDTGIQFAIERLLADPKFLFRIERDPLGSAAERPYRISDFELASRLSFFLWSSLPDEPLLAAAEKNELRRPAVLEREVRRMLADQRSDALVENFVGQWLLLRNLSSVSPDQNVFPEYDENLRTSLERETQMFVESTLHEDRSVVDLIAANYTFVNERLAQHYGIPGVRGNYFRRMTFGADDLRGGLLGQGSLLMVTSYANRTSPVLRGKWVLESLLGTPPPPPPPNVPGLPDRGEDGKPTSVRERLEHHRRNPVCASCHASMDPLGFALEKFDGVGAVRVTEAGRTVDTSAVLPDGTAFEGPAGLRAFLLRNRQQFVRAMTHKLLSYALGREVTHQDMPAVRAIVKDAAAHEYRWSSIVLGIVRADSFQWRQPTASAEQADLAARPLHHAHESIGSLQELRGAK